MKEFKKGHRKGSYNPIAPKGPARAGFRQAPKADRVLQMHQASCVQCKKFCEVPFKPNGKKPVYCRDCFGMQGAEPARPARVPERAVVRTSVVPHSTDLAREVSALGAKIDALTRIVEALVAARPAR